MAGPFGSYLHKNLVAENLFSNITTFGHSSSSSYHWIVEDDFKLSGGVFHKLTSESYGVYENPNPTHWREKVSVPKFEKVLKNNALHSEWNKTLGIVKADIIAIELGANDAASISNELGKINPTSYRRRQEAVIKMVDLIESSGAKCLWIAPPNGIKKSEANQKVLYQFIKEAVGDRCSIYSSNHFKAMGCDGIHFNCASELKNAQNWAREVADFIKINY